MLRIQIAVFSLLLLILGHLAIGEGGGNDVSVAEGHGGVDCARVHPLCGAPVTNWLRIDIAVRRFVPWLHVLIVDELYRNVYTKFQGFVNIELVPYGNARLNNNKSITCQHGEEECKINKYESCAIHFMPEAFPSYIALSLCCAMRWSWKKRLKSATSSSTPCHTSMIKFSTAPMVI
uniref:Uncharacterized protein n=1 Tax=Ditylenchus dipsaci TaxID=166011 RepID=A0A915E6H8_9BILA